MSSVLDRYVENYQRIAEDHVDHWRLTGHNPFQTDEAVLANQEMTVALVSKYAQPGQSLLDAGCGMGDLMLRFPDMNVEGAEIADPYIVVAEERGLNVEWATLDSLPWEEEWFDIITCTDVLEHVLDVNAVMGELVRVLKPGGLIVARVPDMDPVSWEGQKYEFVHLRIFDEGTLRVLFNKIFGCDVLDCVRDQNTIHIVARK